MITLIFVVLKTFHDVTPIYLSKNADLWYALLTDYTNNRLGYNLERKKVFKSIHVFLVILIYVLFKCMYSGQNIFWVNLLKM